MTKKNNKARKTAGAARDPAKDKKPELTNEQKAAKAEADALLGKLLRKHRVWLASQADAKDHLHPVQTLRIYVPADPEQHNGGERLTWETLLPVVTIYKEKNLGGLDFSRCNLSLTDFYRSEFPAGTNFERAILFSSSFIGSVCTDLKFFKSKMDDCKLSAAQLHLCDFSSAVLRDSDFSRARISDCKFDRSALDGSGFWSAKVKNTSFQNADLMDANLTDCAMINSDFTGAVFSSSKLNGTNFSGSTLTAARLYGVARSGWNIDNVKCQYVYWDKDGKERFPPERDFESGEFTNENKQHPEFSYTFKEGITPFDLSFATYIVGKINQANLGFEMKIKNLSVHGLNPTMSFIMISGDEKKDEAKELFKNVRERLAFLEAENKNKDRLIDEATRRADLAENRLPTLIGRTQDTHPLFSEKAFYSFMDRFSNVTESVAQFKNRFMFEQHQYIILWGLGQQDNGISKQELFWIRTELQNFMQGKCLIMLDSELGNFPEDSDARTIYSAFKKRPKNPYLAIAKRLPEQDDRYLGAPVYHDLVLRPRAALNQDLNYIRNSLKYKSITDFELPVLHYSQEAMLCPNSDKIRKLRENKGSREAVSKRPFNNPNKQGERCNLKESSLKRAESDTPIQDHIMDDIACFLEKSIADLTFEKIVPNFEELKKWRRKTKLTKEEVAKRFGVSPPFFDFLEGEEKIIPASLMINVYQHYDKLFKVLKIKFKHPFKSLINVGETKKLHNSQS